VPEDNEKARTLEVAKIGASSLTKQGTGLVRRGLDDLAKRSEKKGRVLLVNDQTSLLEVMEKILVANGYEVRSTSRQQDAIVLAKSFDPQVVVLGITMPLEVGRGVYTASPSWPYLSPKMVLWGEAQEFEDLEQRRGYYDFDLLPTSVNQEVLGSRMQVWMAEAWTNRGNPLHVKEQWLDALKCHEKALAVDARCFSAWLNKAWCLDELGRWREAIDSCDRAIEINPLDSIPWVRKGDMLDRAGQSEQAILCFDSALAMTPDIVSGWMGRGTVLHRLGRYEEAIDSFEKVLEVDRPTWTESGRASVYSDAWNAKGTSLYRMRKYRESVESYEKAIAFDPKSWLPWYNKGNSLRELKDLDGAIRCYDKAVELWPGHSGSWNNKGICLRKLGRLEDALVCHQKAVACSPPDPLGWYNSALVQEDLGRKDDAITSYENFLCSVPAASNEQLKHVLERLQDLRPKTQEPQLDSPRYAYVVREEGAPIEAGSIGYPDIETAILEALKQKSALHEAGELSDEAYRGAIKEYQTMIKEHIQKNRKQPHE
jgi:tetratricopeptide (TPR) repeat protein